MSELKTQETPTIAAKPASIGLVRAGILLDSFDDIFSDFDPRPSSERFLSDDFIAEVKKISRGGDPEQKIFLRLLLPANMRNPEEEKIVLKRIKSYFRNIHQHKENENKKANLKGYYFLVAGTILMLLASYISYYMSYSKPDRFYMHALLSLFEPAAWFMMWAGFDNLIYDSKERKTELVFYSKMARAEIEFYSY